MKEGLKIILEVNDKIKKIAEVLPISPFPEKLTFKQSIMDTMNLIKLTEKTLFYQTYTPQEIYIIGKVFGRLEAIYFLLAKSVEDVREKE